MYLFAKLGDNTSYRNGVINSYMDILKKTELPASICHIAIFSKSGIPIYNSDVWIQMAETREEEEHRQLQSVMRFTQTQLTSNVQDLKSNIKHNYLTGKLCNYLRTPFPQQLHASLEAKHAKSY